MPRAKTKSPPPPRVGRPTKAADQSTDLGRFAARLRAAREKARLSLADAARRCGVPYSTWANWEQGRRWPPGVRPEPESMLSAICNAVRCDIADLIPEGE